MSANISAEKSPTSRIRAAAVVVGSKMLGNPAFFLDFLILDTVLPRHRRSANSTSLFLVT